MVRRWAAATALAGGVAAQIAPGYGESASSTSTISTSTIVAQVTPEAYVNTVATTSSSTTEAVSYTTITFDDCPTESPATMITVTNGKTVTYCPECQDKTGVSGMPASTTKGPGYTTIYTTTYMSLCPSGTVPATYTVTESCTDETPTWTPGSSHIPAGFTTTVKQCTACEGGSKETPVPVTITEPCGCEATDGTSVAPKATPKPTGAVVSQISDGQVQAPTGNNTPASQASDGQVQAPGPSATGSTPDDTCDGTDCGGSGSSNSNPPPASYSNSPPNPSSEAPVRPPYPTTSPAAQCPGPACNAQASGTAPGGSSPASTSPGSPDITSYEGSASGLRICGVFGVVVGIVVGGLAVLL